MSWSIDHIVSEPYRVNVPMNDQKTKLAVRIVGDHFGDVVKVNIAAIYMSNQFPWPTKILLCNFLFRT